MLDESLVGPPIDLAAPDRSKTYDELTDIVTGSLAAIPAVFVAFGTEISNALRLSDEDERERRVRGALVTMLRDAAPACEQFKSDTCRKIAELIRRYSILETVRSTPTEQLARSIAEGSFREYDAAVQIYLQQRIGIINRYEDDAVDAMVNEGIATTLALGAVFREDRFSDIVGNTMWGAQMGAANAERTETERHSAAFRESCQVVSVLLDAIPPTIAPLVDHVLSLAEGARIDMNARDSVSLSIREDVTRVITDCKPVLGVGAEVLPLSVPEMSPSAYLRTMSGAEWIGMPFVAAVIFTGIGLVGMIFGLQDASVMFWSVMIIAVSWGLFGGLAKIVGSLGARRWNAKYSERQAQIPAVLAECDRAVATLRSRAVSSY